MEAKDNISCGIHRIHALSDTGFCVVTSGAITDGVILGAVGIFMGKSPRRSPHSNDSGRCEGGLCVPGSSAPELRCSTGSQCRYTADGRAGSSSTDRVIAQLGTDQASGDCAKPCHGERVAQYPGESFG